MIKSHSDLGSIGIYLIFSYDSVVGFYLVTCKNKFLLKKVKNYTQITPAVILASNCSSYIFQIFRCPELHSLN
jgi:hypothetical protein